MRIKFGMSKVEYDQFTVVIILNVAGRVVGMVVDGVSDVITLGNEQIRPAPELVNGLGSKYIIGLGTIDDRMLILMDIEKLMTSARNGTHRTIHSGNAEQALESRRPKSELKRSNEAKQKVIVINACISAEAANFPFPAHIGRTAPSAAVPT
jgi:hypothetical protein